MSLPSDVNFSVEPFLVRLIDTPPSTPANAAVWVKVEVCQVPTRHLSILDSAGALALLVEPVVLPGSATVFGSSLRRATTATIAITRITTTPDSAISGTMKRFLRGGVGDAPYCPP
ncbi:hypothetical protein GCM10027610_120260 [Dactylosporangium cerinum]